MFRILFTSSGGALGPLNIRLMKASKRYDVSVLAVDQHTDVPARHFADAFATVPNGSDPSYCEAIAELVRQHDINLVLPASDEEALALAGNRSLVEGAGAMLACAPLETLEIMSDKARTYALLEGAGLDVAAWACAESLEALTGLVENFAAEHGEYAVKPAQARGNRGAIVVRGDASGAESFAGSRELHMSHEIFMRDHLRDMPLPAVVMERLVAPAWDIDVLTQNGALLRAMPRRRMNPAGVPFTGSTLDPSDELMDLATRVTKAFSLSWLYDYDVMVTRDGKAVPLEINPRPSGSIAAAVLAGVPFYDDLIALVRGENLSPVQSLDEVVIVPYIDCRIVR